MKISGYNRIVFPLISKLMAALRSEWWVTGSIGFYSLEFGIESDARFNETIQVAYDTGIRR